MDKNLQTQPLAGGGGSGSLSPAGVDSGSRRRTDKSFTCSLDPRRMERDSPTPGIQTLCRGRGGRGQKVAGLKAARLAELHIYQRLSAGDDLCHTSRRATFRAGISKQGKGGENISGCQKVIDVCIAGQGKREKRVSGGHQVSPGH